MTFHTLYRVKTEENLPAESFGGKPGEYGYPLILISKWRLAIMMRSGKGSHKILRRRQEKFSSLVASSRMQTTFRNKTFASLFLEGGVELVDRKLCQRLCSSLQDRFA